MDQIAYYESEDDMSDSNSLLTDNTDFNNDGEIVFSEEERKGDKKRKGDNYWEFLTTCSLDEISSISSGYKWKYKEKQSINYCKIVVKRYSNITLL